MKLRLVYIVMASFLFAQVTCAMSEGAEVFLEAVEHSSPASVTHDILSENHDEVAEHQDELSGVSHCMHSHPPMTFMFNDTGFSFEISEAFYIPIVNSKHVSIRHRPPLSPPKA